MLVKLEIKWIIHKLKKILENIILLVIVLLFWIKWVVSLTEYHFYLKILTGNFLFKWQSKSFKSTKNRKKVKVVIIRITQSLKQKKETEEKRIKKEKKTT